MTEPNVRLALLWHMHQPYYLDPDTGESVLPWVRLHALKDYWGMAALFAEFPGMRATVNLVPSLVEQVRRLCAGAHLGPASGAGSAGRGHAERRRHRLARRRKASTRTRRR